MGVRVFYARTPIFQRLLTPVGFAYGEGFWLEPAITNAGSNQLRLVVGGVAAAGGDECHAAADYPDGDNTEDEVGAGLG